MNSERFILLLLISIVFGDGRTFSQNVGIGTITPLEKLSVVTDLGFGISHEAIGIKLATYIDNNGAWIGTKSNHPLQFYTNDGFPQMTLLQNGNCGIGTTNPQSRLHISTGSAGGVTPYSESRLTLEADDHVYMNFLTPDNKESGILFGLNSNHVHGSILYNSSTPAGFQFRTNGNQIRMVLDQSGKVGIGTNTPTQALDVAGTIKATSYQYETPKTYIQSLSGADFRTTYLNDAIVVSEYLGSCYMIVGNHPIIASVQFPHNAVITSFIVYFTDYNFSDDLIVRLRVGHSLTSFYDELAEITTSGTPGNTLMIDNTISYNPVDNVGNVYFITAESVNGTWNDPSIEVQQIQINYTLVGPE